VFMAKASSKLGVVLTARLIMVMLIDHTAAVTRANATPLYSELLDTTTP
jgi:hypothetical protein